VLSSRIRLSSCDKNSQTNPTDCGCGRKAGQNQGIRGEKRPYHAHRVGFRWSNWLTKARAGARAYSLDSAAALDVHLLAALLKCSLHAAHLSAVAVYRRGLASYSMAALEFSAVRRRSRSAL